jgi:hypothetical protein
MFVYLFFAAFPTSRCGCSSDGQSESLARSQLVAHSSTRVASMAFSRNDAKYIVSTTTEFQTSQSGFASTHAAQCSAFGENTK